MGYEQDIGSTYPDVWLSAATESLIIGRLIQAMVPADIAKAAGYAYWENILCDEYYEEKLLAEEYRYDDLIERADTLYQYNWNAFKSIHRSRIKEANIASLLSLALVEQTGELSSNSDQRLFQAHLGYSAIWLADQAFYFMPDGNYVFEDHLDDNAGYNVQALLYTLRAYQGNIGGGDFSILDGDGLNKDVFGQYNPMMPRHFVLLENNYKHIVKFVQEHPDYGWMLENIIDTGLN